MSSKHVYNDVKQCKDNDDKYSCDSFQHGSQQLYPSEEKPSVRRLNSFNSSSEDKHMDVKGVPSSGLKRDKRVTLTMQELEEEEEVEREFELMKSTPTSLCGGLSQDRDAQEVASGIKIQSINMRDGETGRLIWQTKKWTPDMFEKVFDEYIPSEILQCRTVAREIVFSSKSAINQFRLVQRVFFRGVCIEEWNFKFGFVIPGSTNTWQQLIEAAPPEKMLKPEVLSGNVSFETSFYDDNLFLCKNVFRILYT